MYLTSRRDLVFRTQLYLNTKKTYISRMVFLESLKHVGFFEFECCKPFRSAGGVYGVPKARAVLAQP